MVLDGIEQDPTLKDFAKDGELRLSVVRSYLNRVGERGGHPATLIKHLPHYGWAWDNSRQAFTKQA